MERWFKQQCHPSFHHEHSISLPSGKAEDYIKRKWCWHPHRCSFRSIRVFKTSMNKWTSLLFFTVLWNSRAFIIELSPAIKQNVGRERTNHKNFWNHCPAENCHKPLIMSQTPAEIWPDVQIDLDKKRESSSITTPLWQDLNRFRIANRAKWGIYPWIADRLKWWRLRKGQIFK
jgi:hypothetical protein